MTVEATGPAGAVATYTATATDVIDGTDPVTCVPVSGSIFALGTTQVTCSSTDAHGNKATASFTAKVQDTTAPVLTVPAKKTVEATGAAGSVATYTATAVDGSRLVSCTPALGSTFALGRTQVTFGATDLHGNHASGSTFAIGATTVTCSATDSAHNTSMGSFTVPSLSRGLRTSS